MTTPNACVFCAILRGEARAVLLRQWRYAWAIKPLNLVTPGHTLIIPTVHVSDYMTDPTVSAEVMRCAAEYANSTNAWPSNVITSAGTPATQTVFHLHLHVVPRRTGDGLALPWTPNDSSAIADSG